jgi:hypothetical protein
MRGTLTCTLTPSGRGTLLRHEHTMTATGWARPLGGFLGGLLRRRLHDRLLGLGDALGPR